MLATMLDRLRAGFDAWPAATDADLVRRAAAGRDEDAFALLVRRHGPLVWGVCRRLLGHRQDAEDAFQATFLVLARNPSAVRKGAAVGAFLYGVASRICHKARRRQIGRTAVRLPPRPPSPDAATEVALRELQSIIDEEIVRLPDRFRSAFVLCVLDGRSIAQAAAALEVKPGTLATWLARARALLRTRLAKRGVTLTTALTAIDLARGAESVPPALLTAAVNAGMSNETTSNV